MKYIYVQLCTKETGYASLKGVFHKGGGAPRIWPKTIILAHKPTIQSTNLKHFGTKKVQSKSFSGQIYSLQKAPPPPPLEDLFSIMLKFQDEQGIKVNI